MRIRPPRALNNNAPSVTGTKRAWHTPRYHPGFPVAGDPPAGGPVRWAYRLPANGGPPWQTTLPIQDLPSMGSQIRYRLSLARLGRELRRGSRRPGFQPRLGPGLSGVIPPRTFLRHSLSTARIMRP